MSVAERILSRIVLGAISPTVLSLAGWWGSFGLLGDSPWIGWAALAGLASGMVLDLTVLRHRLDSLFRLSRPALASVAVFYSIMVYGFFMGLPVPNLLVGAGWGLVAGRRQAVRGADEPERGTDVRFAASGAAAIMLLLCCATAWLGLTEPTIASQVRGMLGLGFTPGMDALRAVSVLGGLGLVVSAYFSTRAIGGWAARGGAAGSRQAWR